MPLGTIRDSQWEDNTRSRTLNSSKKEIEKICVGGLNMKNVRGIIT